MAAAKSNTETVQTDVPALPAVGTVVRLDDPAAGGEPSYALVVAEHGVIQFGPAIAYELPVFPA